MANHWTSHSDSAIIAGTMQAGDELLGWLGSLSRDEQLEVMIMVKKLLNCHRFWFLGVKGALELVRQIRKVRELGIDHRWTQINTDHMDISITGKTTRSEEQCSEDLAGSWP